MTSSMESGTAAGGSTLGRAAWGLVGFGLGVALWWASIRYLADPEGFLARFGPADAASALWEIVATGAILEHVLASLERITVGLAIAVVLGLPLGVAIGVARPFARLVGAPLQFVRMISPLSWTPLAIVLFGVGDAPVYFLVAVGAIWPVVLNTSSGIATLDRDWLTVGRSLGATRWELVRDVMWPGIRADVVTGLRLATGLAWIIIVPAEMLGVDSGLGYFILDSRDRFAYGELVAAIIVIGVLGALIDGLTRWLLRTRRERGASRHSRSSSHPMHTPGPVAPRTASRRLAVLLSLSVATVLAPMPVDAQLSTGGPDGTELTLEGYLRMRGSRYEDLDLDRATAVDEARTFYDARAYLTLTARRSRWEGVVSLDVAGDDFDDGALLGNENPALMRPSEPGLRHLWIGRTGRVNARLGRQPARLGHGIVTHVVRDAFRVWHAVDGWVLNGALIKGGETAVNAPTGEDDDLDALALFLQRAVGRSVVKIEVAGQIDSSPTERFPEKRYVDVNAAGVLGSGVSYRVEAALLRGRTPAVSGRTLDYSAHVVFAEAHAGSGVIRPGVRVGRGSGDDDSTDDVQGNFASLFLDETHFAYTTVFADDLHGFDGSGASLQRGAGFANVTFVQPRIEVQAGARLGIEGAVTLLRATRARTVGTGPLGDRVATGSGTSKEIGLEVDVGGTLDVGDGGRAIGRLGWFRPGAVYGTAPDVLKGEVWLELSF